MAWWPIIRRCMAGPPWARRFHDTGADPHDRCRTGLPGTVEHLRPLRPVAGRVEVRRLRVRPGEVPDRAYLGRCRGRLLADHPLRGHAADRRGSGDVLLDSGLARRWPVAGSADLRPA